MIKTILLDLDGILFSIEIHHDSILKEFLDLTNSPLPPYRVKQLIDPNHLMDFVKEMLEGYGINHDKFNRDIFTYLYGLHDRVSYKELIFIDVPLFLKWLFEKLGVLSQECLVVLNSFNDILVA